MEVWLSDDRLMKCEDYELAKDEIIGRLDNESFYGLYKAFLEAQVRLECEKWTDDRMLYVFKAPEILEKAWKMPFREDKEAYLRPVVCLVGLENLDERIERSNHTCMAILEDQGWFLRNKSFEKKDWRDFK